MAGASAGNSSCGTGRIWRSACATSCPTSPGVSPQATYLAWLDLRGVGLGDDPAKWLLHHARVALSPGYEFGAPGVGFARLNFATTTEILDLVVTRIVEAVRAR